MIGLLWVYTTCSITSFFFESFGGRYYFHLQGNSVWFWWL